MLRTLKSQRTRLVKKITEEVSKSAKLENQSVGDENMESLKGEVAVSLSVLGDFRTRFEDLSNEIAKGLCDCTDEELDKEGEFVMDTIASLTRTLSQLSVFHSTLSLAPVGPVNDGSVPGEGEEYGSNSGLNALQEKIDKLIELQILQSRGEGMASPMSLVPGEVQRRQAVKLPKLEFEKFSGDVLRFQEFWDSFDAAIHSNQCLLPVEKLNYLRAYLTGEARNVISGVSTCEANYEVAVQLIQKRFGNPQASIDAHYSRLANLPIVPNHTSKIRSLFDEVEKHLRCLSALGEDTEHRHFISLIMSKLPREVITRLEESKLDEDSWTVDLVRKKLQSLLNAREAAERQRSPNQSSWYRSDGYKDDHGYKDHKEGPSHGRRSWYGGKIEPVSTTESLVASEKSRSKGTNPFCSLCRGPHFSDQCTRFKTIEERRRCLHGRCFVCLQKGHQAPHCSSTKPCYYCKKVKKHNRCLCPAKFSPSFGTSAVTVEDEADVSIAEASTVSQHTVLSSGDRVLLQTATVELSNCDDSSSLKTRVLLDCASNRSYVSSSLARRLKLKPSGKETFSVVTFGSEKPKTVETTTASVQLMLKNDSPKVLDVNVVLKITGAIHRSPVKLDQTSFLWRDLPLADSLPSEAETSSVDFLIGNDYYLDLVTSQKIQIGDGLYLLGSKLGWLLTGRVEGGKESSPSMSMFVSSMMNSSIPEISLAQIDPSLPVKPSFEDFWKLESIGILDRPDENDDDKALAQFNLSVKRTDGRYEVTWPWKESFPDLPNNYHLSLGRFKSLLKKFQADSGLLCKYDAIIKDQEKKGVIERVPDDINDDSVKHYIPHHPVITPLKTTTKVRIVYDASAKVRKDAKSLNECLFRGPVILEDLCGLLIRFRLNRIAIVADIEKAFLQIGLQQQERDVTRFFWFKDASIPEIKDNLQIYRFCRVPFGVISSPFLLGATVRYHLRQSGSDVAKKIERSIYVDNVIAGAESPAEALGFYKEAKLLFKDALMNLREWASNSKEFTEKVHSSDKIKNSELKVLGLYWDTNADCVTVSGKSLNGMRSATTKREMLKSLASVFDPLGLFTPLTVKAKVFLHSLWDKQLQWDTVVEDPLQREWIQIAEELANISNYKVDRFVGIHGGTENVSIFCFCDASALAYSAAVYLKVSSQGSSRISLVFAKTRLPPSKKTSIPRLELLAMVIAVRCLTFVENQLQCDVKDKIIWSDSQCVLHWIRSKKPMTVFVENRLREIRRRKDISFRYINTSENPADLATRGKATFDELKTSSWWEGPVWLCKEESCWPTWPDDVARGSPTEDEFDAISNRIYEAGLNVTEVKSSPPFIIDVERFSSLVKLYRVTAWSARFVDKLCRKITREGSIDSTEIAAAKALWDVHLQKEHFPEIYVAIENGTKCNLKEQLNIQKDEKDILRCHGRFLNSDLSLDARYPKILPKKSHYTDLVIKCCHEKLFHAGTSHTLSQLILEYWIPQGRSTVRHFISHCRICRRYDGGPYAVPRMPPFPASRVSKSSPFSFTGLDYLGPLNVKSMASQVDKVWVCLFTCLSVRAVHLELVSDMSAEQFLLCLRRFIATRGKPIQIISDNAAQFKVSKGVMERVWGHAISDPDLKSYVASEGISWKFIVERAPWMGGFYERLVGSVKRALKKGLGRLCLKYDQLITSLAEVEAVVNSRPLTYVGSDFGSGASISPSDFLCLNPNPGIPQIDSDNSYEDPTFIPYPDSKDVLISTWRKGHKLLNGFWKIWREDYLSGLRERADYVHKRGRLLSKVSPSVGQVVLVKDDSLPRGSWKLGRIERLLPSSDGEPRGVRLKLPSGNFLNRPLMLLYPLECSGITSKDDREETLTFRKLPGIQPDVIASRLPERHSKTKAREWMKRHL